MKIKTPLLTARFLSELQVLRDIIFREQKKGEGRGLVSGLSPEFDSHRSYEPGDDPRYIDWNIYARLEKLLLKIYNVDEEGKVVIMVDNSRSMREYSGKKINMAVRMAAAFSCLALSSGRNLVLGVSSDRLLSKTGPHVSFRCFPAVLEFLANVPDGEGTDIRKSSCELLGERRETGMLIIISDFFQEDDLVRDLDRFRYRGIDPYLVQVLDDAELSPSLTGYSEVSDLEGDGNLRFFAGADLLARFRRSIEDYIRGLESACRSRSIPYLMALTSQNFEDLILGHILSGSSEGGGNSLR